MKRIVIPLILSILLLTACAKTPAANTTPQQTPAETPPQSQQPSVPAEIPQGPCHLSPMTVELVVSWAEADLILGELDSLAELLTDALAQQDYEAEEITVTVNTAGGFTGDALSGGGIDIALLPAVDYVSCEEDTFAVLVTTDRPSTGVVAVSGLREDFDEAFRLALSAALLETEEGLDFLHLYNSSLSYEPATETALQAVRDWVANQVHPEHSGA